MSAYAVDQDAERVLLGDMLTFPHHLEEVFELVSVEDLASPDRQAVFSTVERLWRQGEKPTAYAVADELAKSGELELVGGRQGLASLAGAASGNYKRAAAIITRLALHRRVMHVVAQASEKSTEAMADPAAFLEWMQLELAAVDVPIGKVPADVWDLDVFLDRPNAVRPPWVLTGLLRKGWRALVIAPEGYGKSVLFRQLAMCAAQGIHPLYQSKRCDPVRSLIVDLENPEEAIDDICTPIRTTAQRTGEYQPGRAFLWHRPGGINLRTRTGKLEFEAVLRHTRPQFVALGPLYKCYSVAARESDELAAGEVQRVLDDLRVRYGFALALEHHAPKKASGHGSRELTPYGSSLWLRWPEFGLSLTPTDERGHVLAINRHRGDRLKASWPDELHRSQPWPWVGKWNHAPDGDPDA